MSNNFWEIRLKSMKEGHFLFTDYGKMTIYQDTLNV